MTIENIQIDSPSKVAQAAADELKLTLTAAFVPWSASRHAGEKTPSGRPSYSLNWRVTLYKEGRPILTTDYSAGIAHAPSYPKGYRAKGFTSDEWEAIKIECETGKRAAAYGGGRPCPTSKRVPDPNLLDVLHCLLMDSDALDAGGFEDWAANYGYDVDSRKAESIYRQCLEMALKLRNALGEANLTKLRQAFQDY